jgi:hypothetical protein
VRNISWDPFVQTPNGGCTSGAPQAISYSSDTRVALMARFLNIEFDPEKGYVPQLREALRARGSQSTTRVTLPTGIPDGYLLSPAFPNPFRTTTEVRFFVPRTEAVSLRVYDAMGREVAVLFDEIAQTGMHQVVFTSALCFRLNCPVLSSLQEVGADIMTESCRTL